MDTAANSMAFAIHELARQPDRVPALIAEIDSALAEGITVEALQRMPMLMVFSSRFCGCTRSHRPSKGTC